MKENNKESAEDELERWSPSSESSFDGMRMELLRGLKAELSDEKLATLDVREVKMLVKLLDLELLV